MKKVILILVLAAVVIFSDISCKKDENNDDEIFLDHNYSGTLFLLLSNSYPQFIDSTSLPVEVNQSGHMTFGIGELQYSGEDNNGQSKIRRQGELILAPNGYAVKDDDRIWFAVDENTTVDETFKVWIWDGSDWLLQVNETVSDTWNDGLAFPLDEAETTGAVVSTMTANGTVKWTLFLAPKIE